MTDNNNLQPGQPVTTPAWAFLLGWWFCVTGGWKLFNIFLDTMKEGLAGSGSALWSEWFGRLGSLWPILIGGVLIGTGFLLLRSRENWKKIVILVSVIAFADYVITNASSFLDMFEPGFSMLPWGSLIAFLLNAAAALLFSLLIILFVRNFDRFDSPDLTLLTIFLLVTGFTLLEYPITSMVYYIEYALATPGLNTVDIFKAAIGPLIALLFPMLFILSGFSLQVRPIWIRKFTIVYWLVGILIVAVSVWDSVSIWNSRFQEPGYMAYALTGLFSRLYNFLLPISLTILVAGRYMDCFRAEENRIRGLNLCVHCSYDLTGNTTGRCPECGATTTMSQEQRETPEIDAIHDD